ncbi:ubiquitin thioesterase otulin isoform X7 [Acipenser ruthenus]|uniref:ubiquitin thioesterase otulin isoform X7 n=1 Tax=Acipenser ruthenus TaxID=7906 RepID=UPI00145B4C05|nr:ubiquitin thioesterase otulin isoform X7 [Acipenser ruthenus]
MGGCCSGPPAQPEEAKGLLVTVENEQDSTSKNHVETQAEARGELTDAPLQSDKEDEHLYNGVHDKSQENNEGVTPVDRVAEGGVVKPACSETVAVHQESESISLPKRKTLAAGPEHTAHTAFAGSVTEATVTQEEHKQPASSADCTVEENTADTQAFESPDQPDSAVEVNIVQSLEDIGEDLTEGGKKAEVEESAVDMKDTQWTPSIEMELESQSVTQEKPSAPKPLKSLDEKPMREMSAAVEDEDNASEVDLYRGAEEIEEDQLEKNGAKGVDDFMDKCSISPEVDILIYSENEWRGNTAKSAQIKKAYEEVHKSFSRLRRVRGDNYCALRATLFQALIQSKEVPAWLQREDFIQLPEKLASCYDWLRQWRFTQEYANGNWMELLKGHMQLLKRKWLAVVESSSAEERQAVCDEIFRNEEEEYSLLEAVKLLMLNTAIELYNDMQQEKDVPIFCWLLFARDSSVTPCTFLSNHLNQVGFSGGLEQVEMFLLGYALELTINVYRLYKFETDEFLTFYPDDHKEDWPVVSLITEDDRHYNVPVQKQDTARL